ncbi:GNAT family N-acetyltransferase [Phytobacter sp. V91]|uniref:GNAT family N-acetyltransferase n=1 Tax=Phytobacter sp. V91 TaxID=3369425 RepID=UPI003F64162F
MPVSVQNIIVKTTMDNIPWQRVADLLHFFGLSDDDARTQEKIFRNSYLAVFLFDGEELIGVGRLLSDGICQAAIYNVALDKRYQGAGLGKRIIQTLINAVKECNIILYTHPDTVGLYENLGFQRMKTGMALYRDAELAELKLMDFI